MSYSTVICEHCGSKQVLMIDPEAHETRCSACAKMIQLRSEPEKKEEVIAEPQKAPEAHKEVEAKVEEEPAPEKKRKRRSKKQDA